MKLLSYGLDKRLEPRLAILLNGYALDVMRASLWMKENHNAQDYLTLASAMELILGDWDRSFTLLKNLEQAFQDIELTGLRVFNRLVAHKLTDLVFFAPVPKPPTLRYFNAFEADDGFIFGNTQTLQGHDQTLIQTGLKPQGEIAAILGGRRESLKIAGYCVANNWQHGRYQSDSGLSHGLATSLGPCLVTADELQSHQLGNGFDLGMQIRINGKAVAENRFKNMMTGFPAMIQKAAPTNIQAGDVFCCGAPDDQNEIGATKIGDRVEVEIQVLGTLSNRIVDDKEIEPFR